jgi:hypothetical protein
MLGISLYSYPYLKLAKKRYVFLIICYVFSSTKARNKRTEQVLPRSGGGGGGGWGVGGKKGVLDGVERWPKLCAHM